MQCFDKRIKRNGYDKDIQNNPCYIFVIDNYSSSIWISCSLDAVAYIPTGLKTLAPTGPSAGKTIIIYYPDLSGTQKGVADKVAIELQMKSFTVTDGGVKSSAATNISD
jgi:hypothetical protein